MTEEEIHKHIGTIAKSGTKEFMEKLEKAKEGGDHNLIGQFGVGFYSAFMVAESVDVITRSGLDEKAHKWSSDGKSGYELEETTKESRGTQVVLKILKLCRSTYHDARKWYKNRWWKSKRTKGVMIWTSKWDKTNLEKI